MRRVGFGVSKNKPPQGYVSALLCDNSFYVITKRQYMLVQRKTKRKKPVFHTDIPVYIDGINI